MSFLVFCIRKGENSPPIVEWESDPVMVKITQW